MASDAGAAQRSLNATLEVARGGGSALGFYAALRRIECAHPEMPRLGEAAAPSVEPVRFAQEPSLAFQATPWVGVEDSAKGHPPRLSVGFFGLFGPQGPLPLHLTEYACQRRAHHGDQTFGRFVDLFHHRLISLFYRAWANAQPTVHHDRPGRDGFARYLGSFIGQSPRAETRAPDEVDHAALFSALHFAGRTRHAEGLVKSLQAALNVPIAIEEFVGQWLQVPDEFCWKLRGATTADQAPIGALGIGTRLGTEVWDRQSKFRVVIGPVARAVYERFLPGGDQLARLVALVGRYAGPELGWDMRLVLQRPDRRAAVLGAAGLIGRTAHLGGSDADTDALFQDLLLDPAALAA